MDQFENSADSLIAPAKDAFVVVPSDSAMLPEVTKAIYIGTGGHVVLRPVDGKSDIRFASVGSGAILPVRVSAVRLTGTTATDIVGLV